MARPQIHTSRTKLAPKKNQAFNSVVMARLSLPEKSLGTFIRLMEAKGSRYDPNAPVAGTLTCFGVTVCFSKASPIVRIRAMPSAR